MATVSYRPQALETIARRTLSEYDPMYLNGSPRAVPIETIIEKTFGLRIEYQYLTNDARELGRMIYDSGITTYYNRDIMDYALMRVEGGTMLIEAALLEDEKSYGRLRFTLAHELAHYIIHKQIFSGTGVAAALYNNDTDEDATEWQANYLAKAILIADQEDTPDYTEEIKRKESEIERLSKKRVNLIEMRAEGDIDKELFRERKQEIENRIAILTEEIKTLQPDETKQSPQNYMQKLQELRERLKEYTGFEYSVIPESVVEAFIEKIWVSKDEFRWYLRSGNGSSDEFDIDDYIKTASFTLTIDDAKKYLYSFSIRRRVYNWKDLNVSVWI